MKRKGLAVGLILLFIVSIVVPMAIGYNNKTQGGKTSLTGRVGIFNCYHNPDTTNSLSLVYAEEKTHYEQATNVVSQTGGSGLMNSSWPMFCHDVRHTGQSPYSTVNTTGVEKWRFLASGWIEESPPIIDNNGIIYFSGDHLYAVYPNGSLKCVYNVNAHTDSAPAIDENGVLYIGTSNPWDGLYAFYPNGTVKWFYDTGQIVSSPAIGDDGTIYFGTADSGNPPRGSIYALNSNGTLRWRFRTGHVVYSSPAIDEDGIVYCGSHDGNLYALYPNNGTMKWAFPAGYWVRVSPCIADDGTIYCVSLNNYLFAINPNGTMKWKTDVGAGTSPTIGRDGTIYAGYSNLYAINPINGSVKWTFNPGSGSTIRGGTPCNSADGTIYFGTSDGGYIYAVNPDGTEKWRCSIGTCDSAPAIGDDGTVCIVTSHEGGGYLHAFGPGESKQIKIQEPKIGHFYLFDHDMGTTSSGKTIVIGKVTIKVNVSSIQDIERVDFCVGHWAAWNPSIELKYTDTEPPFEWTLKEYMGNDYHPYPFDNFIIQVVGWYKGGCEWIDQIPKFWYFHLLKK